MRSPSSPIAVLLTVAALGVAPAAARSAAAPPKALDLVPEDAAFALVVPNLADLRDKGDKFFAENNVRPDTPRPSDLFKEAFDYLGIAKGLDEKGSAAVILPNFKTVGIENLELLPIALQVVVAVPVKDLGDMASNFGLKAEDLKRGKVRAVKGKLLGQWFVQSKGKHLLLGFGKTALAAVAAGKPLTGQLPPAQASALAKADVALHVGADGMGPVWKHFLPDVRRMLTLKPGDADNSAVEEAMDALAELRFVTAGLRLGDEPAIDLVASFPKADAGGAKAVKFLSALRGGPGASDLTGLPRVEPLIAYAAKGDGERNVVMARALLKRVLDNWLGIQVFAAEADRQKFLDTFGVMYRRLKGSRAVVYRTATDKAEKVGAVASVVILDVDDPAAHLGQWTKLVEVATAAAPKIVREGRESAPRFHFRPKSEKLDGLPVDVVSVEIPGIEPEVEADYRRLLGPDWNKLRMVVQGKRVVGLFGSDVDTLRQTLRNLKDGNKGLAENKAVTAALGRLRPERKIQIHFDLKQYVDFYKADVKKLPPVVPAKALSSVALTMEPDRLHLELRVPRTETNVLVQLLGLSKE